MERPGKRPTIQLPAQGEPPPGTVPWPGTSTPSAGPAATPEVAGQGRASGPPKRGRGLVIAFTAGAAAVLCAVAVIVTIVVSRSHKPVAEPAAVTTSASLSSSVQNGGVEADTNSPEPSVEPEPATPTESPLPTTEADIQMSQVRNAPQLADVAAVLDTYFSGINDNDPSRAASAFGPGGSVNPDNPQSVHDFGVGVSTSYDDEIVIASIRPASVRGERGLIVAVRFRSMQDPDFGPDRETCTEWSLRYHMIYVGDAVKLINSVNPNHFAC